jgi:hypothetical protein
MPVLLLMVQILVVSLLYVTARPEVAEAETVAVPNVYRIGAELKVMVCVVLLLPPQPASKSVAQADKPIPNAILFGMNKKCRITSPLSTQPWICVPVFLRISQESAKWPGNGAQHN